MYMFIGDWLWGLESYQEILISFDDISDGEI